MSHQQLAITFHKTAVDIKNSCLRNLTHEEICRAVYGRLYYALYHKYLEHDSALASSSKVSKHLEMTNRIRDNHSTATFQLYRKMQDLRIWSDYKSDVHAPPGATNALLTINTLSFRISDFINQQNFQ